MTNHRPQTDFLLKWQKSFPAFWCVHLTKGKKFCRVCRHHNQSRNLSRVTKTEKTHSNTYKPTHTKETDLNDD